MNIRMIHYYCFKENCNLTQELSKQFGIVVKSIFEDNIKNVIINVRNYNHIGMIVLDVKAFSKNTESEMSDGIISLRMGYSGKLIILADGYEENSAFIQKIRQGSIKYILLSSKQLDDSIISIIEEKEIIQSVLNETPEAVHEKLNKAPLQIKPNKNIKIGICGAISRIGTTHHSISLAKYLCDNNYKSCYIEANEHNDIKQFADWIDNVTFGKNYYEYNKMKMYLRTITQSELGIKDFYISIYDFGVLDETNSKAFLECDIKIIVTGSKPWELTSYGRLYAGNTGLKAVNTIMNFVPDSAKDELYKLFNETKLYFASYSPDMFSTQNDEIYNLILEGYNEAN